MPNRDDHRGFGGRGPDRDQERWDHDGDRGRSGRGERRWFGEPNRSGSDQGRYGSRQDQDRNDYGSGFDRQGGGYGRGQEYGIEAGRGRDAGDDQGYGSRGAGDQARESWSPGGGGLYGELRQTGRNRGVEQYGQPADYAYRPGGGQEQHEHEPHEHDHDFRNWRDEQMRNHDRDYHEWRQAQHKQYNDEYQNFRSQRREHFGQRFEDWRRTRGTTGGVAESSVTPGMSSTGQHNTNAGDEIGRPTGGWAAPHVPEGGGQAQGGQGAAAKGSEFGKEPSAVQATSEGKFRGDAAKDDNKH
jgi:hypothetical protein